MAIQKINISVFREFFKSQKVGGVILLCCVFISLLIANGGFKYIYNDFLNTEIGFQIKNIHLHYPILIWINDGLMAIFFLLVGLEIKRELIEGELSTTKKAILPVVAALGGMVVPAVIYFIINKGQSTSGGWGIPMATDIAFALAIISILGKNVPPSLKIFLAALAIVDDLGAILVIAIFYTNQIHWDYFMMALGVFTLLMTLNYFNVKTLFWYLFLGVFLWYFVHHSGIHATIAGVLLAFTIPTNESSKASPLEKLEHFLNTPVNYIIMPIFALANTNITFEKQLFLGLISPLGMGVILGLFLGKMFGVSFFSWLAVKSKLSDLPSKANFKHILGLGMLAGIGFTMSIFISLLSFSNETNIAQAKIAILCASLISGLIGFIYLKKTGQND